MALIRCDKCGHLMSGKAPVCRWCAKPLVREGGEVFMWMMTARSRCPHCERVIDGARLTVEQVRASTCPFCGQPVKGLAEARLSGRIRLCIALVILLAILITVVITIIMYC